MELKKLSHAALILLFFCLRSALADAPAHYFVINEDNDHYFKLDSSLMTLDALEKYIDSMSETNVTHFFMCANGQRTSYRTSVWEAIWDDVGGRAPDDIWPRNAKKLFDAGIDPYSVWVKRCRKNGISAWMSMRMNDVHFVTVKNYFRNMEFWRNNPHLWRVPGATGGAWTDFAFDYSKEEVRNFSKKLVRELLERYDVDGLELDWMRFCLHLPPKKAYQMRSALTGFVRDVKGIVSEFEKRRGHKIGLGVRVPVDPQMSAWMGMDAVEWDKEGLVDLVVASCFFSSTDFDMSAKKWREAGLKAPLLCAADNGVCAALKLRRVDMDVPMYNAWVANMIYAGFDNGVYLFNLVYSRHFADVIRADWSPAAMESLPRRHVLTFHDYMEVPRTSKKCEQLPRLLDKPVGLEIQCAKIPRTASVSARVDFKNAADFDTSKFSAILNGQKCKFVVECDPVLKGRRGVRFGFDRSAAKDGANLLEISQLGGSARTLEWAEVEINLPR